MLNVEASGSAGGGSASFQIVKLRFCHADTGAILERRLPSESDTAKMMQGGGNDEDIEFCGTSKPAVASNDASCYLLDDHDDEEHDEPNYYEEDDFLVNGSQDSEEEFDSHEEEDNEEDGECQICKNGGDLIVCDGGDHEGGCGLAYHIHCIGRSIIPPGEFKRH